jgi:Zn-dependent protease with chaperone function
MADAVQPNQLLAKLAKPTARYKRQAWLAMAGLVFFVLLYFGLATWFGYTAYRLTFGAEGGSKNAVWGWLIGGCAAFLSVFMLKAVVFVKHVDTQDSIELRPDEQPELFKFLYRLADKAGAPRPHRVFASPRVNAAVFYDLSLLNLVFPSRKNLEIGLGLVNSLNLGEFRAVLAHEFGHFAQRAMAVGRWVYVAQQIAGHLVARRDKLDAFLRGLSHFDVRLAWIGWILSAIVWSIRSLVDSAFQLVVLMQRALSREMEMNADLVAVSLTGSDALIHALHRLQTADDAWGRAATFVVGQKNQGKLVPDLFAIQSQVVAHMGQLLNDPAYGAVPPITGFKASDHRLFKPELAQPPQMWLSHPLNHEREANAKRHYVMAPIDERSAWALFAKPQLLRAEVTAKLLSLHPSQESPAKETVPVTQEQSLQVLDEQFSREYFSSRYRGVYFSRSITRHAEELASLYEPVGTVGLLALDRLYPTTLSGDMERLRTLEKEVDQLRALHLGVLQPSGGVILHRGRVVKRSQLAGALAEVEAELAAIQNQLQAHDRRCRSLHLAIAEQMGGEWPAYLKGLLAALHYADHTEANLRDLHGLLRNTVAVTTATRRVSDAGIKRILQDGGVLHAALDQVFTQSVQVVLDDTLLKRLEAPRWADALGALKLPPVDRGNVGDWLGAVDGWVDHAAACCGALRTQALEQLLLTEGELAGHLRANTVPAHAPTPSQIPANFTRLCIGRERKRQTRLGWWGRFQTADGWLPATARLLVAGGVVGAVLGLGRTVGEASVSVYNGLSRPVVVTLAEGSPLHVAPRSSSVLSLPATDQVKIVTRTEQGELIEQFEADARRSFGQFVYNVAGAAPLVEATVSYGNAAPRPERLLGAPRWTHSSADVLFTEPPKSISSKTGGGTREALIGLGAEPAAQQLGLLTNEADVVRMATVRARWEPLTAPDIAYWFAVLSHKAPHDKSVLATRLAQAPNDMVLLRLEQDSASDTERSAVCSKHQARAAAEPGNANWQYLTIRCLNDEAAKGQAFVAGYQRFPANGWFAYAAA